MSEVKNAISFIESFVPERMKKGKIPGVSVAVVSQDEVVYAAGFGVRDETRGLPATADTLYGIGSCTKSIVAMSILQLQEKGKLKVGDPVSDYVPLKIGLPDRPVKIHDLLTHSPGIPNLGTVGITLYRYLGPETGIPWGSSEDFYRFVNGAGGEIAFEPGQRFFYLNTGYEILGHVIQEVSGMSFDSYVEENIFKPLKMTRATFSKGKLLKDPDRLTPYRKKQDGALEATDFPYPDVAENPGFSFLAASGGALSSVRELTNYLRANLNGGILDGVRVLSPESMEIFQHPYVERPREYWGKHSYGYGWNITEGFFGHNMVSHSGSILVSTAYQAMIPDLKIGIAAASNITGFPYSALAEGTFAALMGKNPADVVPSLKIDEMMDTLIGEYKTYKGLAKTNVVNRGGMLYLEQVDDGVATSTPLVPEEGSFKSGKFFVWSQEIKQPVEFVVHSKDQVDLYVERNRFHKT